MEAFVVNTSKLVGDVIACIAELKNTFQSEGQPINDDDVTLQKFCIKLETILRHEQKEKYTLLGIRKDYWNFITDVISKDDGVKYVNMVPQMKTAQGKGRCFIRYALVKQTLADNIQRLIVSGSILSSWYRRESILRNPSLSTALINKLYDLNDMEFDLPCAGYDLDISWPAFSRKTGKEGNTSGRRSSISSINSVDFRNERRDPLVDLAAEIASLMEFFETDDAVSREGKPKYDNISLSSASETPTINELTLQVSGIHKRALQWKADFVNERATTAQSLRKAQDDRQFAIQESELKTKQMMEKFNRLAKAASEENEKKITVLTEALTKAEESLQQRDSELRGMREEVNKSVVSTSTAHKSAIELEKQLMASERKRTELESEVENLNFKIQSSEHSEGEFSDREKRLKEKMAFYEEKELEYKDIISELRGNLKAKEVALENIQASFEKLTGMVFGSFEELETNMKEKLVDKEKGLQNQTLENRKLELQVTDLQHQLKEAKSALTEHKSQLNSMEASYKDVQSSKLELKQLVKDRDERLTLYTTFLLEVQNEFEGEANVEDENTFASINNKQAIQENLQTLLSNVKDSKLEISKAHDRNIVKDKILADRQEDIQRLTELTEQHKQHLNKLQNEVEEKQNAFESFTKELEEANNEINRLNKNNHEAKSNINSLSEEVKFLTDEKTSIEAQVIIDKQQLEMANEARIRAECAQVKAKEELKNLKCVLDQEVAALKFQLSSETMKFEEEIKVFSEQTRENEINKERCLTLEDTIAYLESNLKERTNEWDSEKRKHVNEIKRLRSQVQLLNNAFEGNKQNMMTLENDLILTRKQLEEERIRYKQQVQEIETRKVNSERQLQEKINETRDDMKDLKNKIVSLTREKADLWGKAAEYEYELKLKATDRWVEDNEVNKCSSCKTEFSFLLRKHHCRLCGRIFCNSCSNNWVRTAHSSKMKRVCNGCLSKDQRLKPQHRDTDSEDLDETMSDISIGTSPKQITSNSSVEVNFDDQAPLTSAISLTKQDHEKDVPPNTKYKKTRSAIIHETEDPHNYDSFGGYEDFSQEKTDKNITVDSRKVESPKGDDYEFIDQNEEIGELPESRVVVNDADVREELLIPAVNDEEGISRDFTISPGTRHVIPVMVATPGASLCWSFKTAYKSIIFGLAYKQSESISDDDIETLYPLAPFSSNVAPVEGEWKASNHGVYILVFDNTFSRFTSKQTSCFIHVKRRPSILKPS